MAGQIMIVEKELVKKAKEKLGNRNAELIAEILELPDYDRKNQKACCPYHSESTPSFIYNPKNYSFHCFGCNKNVDLIDVLMEKGKSFLDATKFVFEQADIDCSFGEQTVKTKRDYKYPHEEENGNKEQVVEYLGRRGISKNVIDYLDIRQDNNGNCVFNYYDTNDVLTLVKYRPARPVPKGTGQPKTWCQKGSDTSPLLFNMNRINVGKPLLLSEGEIDSASAIEAGYLNTVSVPFGAGNFHWIEENWDWLNQFETIIIWSDNDEAGLKMRKECLYRLGTWRTKYIITPEYIEKNGKKIKVKDINECLQIGGKDFVMKLISDAKDVPVTSVVDYSELEELDISQMDGVKTGIKPVDNELLKIFYGTLTVLSGRPGCVDSETEYFNGKEWKKISEYRNGEMVLQYNSDGTTNLVFPEYYHKYACEEFWKFKTESGINQMLSDEHNIVYLEQNFEKENLVKKNIIDFIREHENKKSKKAKFITTFDYEGGGISLTDDEICLMCILLTSPFEYSVHSGNCHLCINRIKNPVKWNRIIKLLKKTNTSYEILDWEFTGKKRKRKQKFISFLPPMIVSEFDDFWYKCSKNQLSLISEEISKYGVIPTNKGVGYYTNSKQNADFIQFAFSASGYRSEITLTSENNYLVSKTKDIFPAVRKLSDFDKFIKVKSSDGYKYCFTVPSGMLVLRRHGVINITGNSGKTSIVDQTIAHTIDTGNPVFLFSKEMPERMSANWFNTILAGRRNMVEKISKDGNKYSVVPINIQRQMQDYYTKKLFIYRDDESNDVAAVIKSAEECVRKFGCKLIVLDNLMMIDLNCSESDKNTAQTNLMNQLIKFAAKFNVAVILIAHPRKTQDMNSDIEMYDISGTSNIINLAMRSIGLRRVSKKEKADQKSKWKNYDVVLSVIKDRLLGKADFQVGLWYDLVSRRFYTDYAEYDNQYKWDANVYNNKLPYIDRNIEEEDFPDK